MRGGAGDDGAQCRQAVPMVGQRAGRLETQVALLQMGIRSGDVRALARAATV